MSRRQRIFSIHQLAIGVGESVSVDMSRVSDENGATIYVRCQFYGTFEKAL